MSSKIAIGLSRILVRSFALVLLGGVLTAACGTNASTNTPGTTGTPGASAPAATGNGAGTGTPAASGTQPASSAGTGTPGTSTTPGTMPSTMGTTPMGGTMGAAGAGMMAAGGGTGGMGGGAAGAGMATAGTGAGTGGTMAPADCMKGTTKGSEVVMIGDSYLALSGDVTTVLEQTASMAGAPSGYRTYYVSGTSMGNGQIPSQFDQALAADKDIKFVIMDGGGNDILLLNPMCQSLADPGSDPSCMKSVADSETAGAALLQKMGDNGVQQVVWFFYPNLDPGLGAGSMPNNILSYGFPIMQKMCEGATAVKCHFVDIRPAFMGMNAQYIGFDGIHPTLAGSTAIAGLIWDTMKANCIAQ
ncbi:MAG: SGNH/GDSL hydrolase family protein [Polyangiales bacterium]